MKNECIRTVDTRIHGAEHEEKCDYCRVDREALEHRKNLIDRIAALRGWLPLTVGEKVTVHFHGQKGPKYVIRRVR